MFDCNYIWSSLQFQPDGSIKPCCVFKPTEAGTMSQSEPHNSPVLRQVRSDVLEGKEIEGCKDCVSRSKFGDKRIELSFKNYHPTSKTPYVDYSQIEVIDLRIGNVCNFMCYMCSAQSSHLIAKEIADITNNQHGLPIHRVWTPEQEELILDTLQKCSNLKTLWIAGGEPFYNKQLFLKILDHVWHIRDKLTLRIMTNCSIYDQDIVDKLSQFKKLCLALSIDSVSKSNEIQRWKADNRVILETFDKFKQAFGNNAVFSLSPVITNMNYQDVAEYINYFDSDEYVSSIDFVYVTVPEWTAINTVKKEVREKVADVLASMSPSKVNQYEKVVAYMRDTPATSDWYNEINRKLGVYKKSRGLEMPPEYIDNLEK